MRRKYLWLLAAVLTALLVATAWYCVAVWRTTPAMPLYGNIIMAMATTLALVAGCALIALLIYSHRKGHDEPTRSDRTPRE